MSGIIGGTGNKSGVIGGVGHGLGTSIDSWCQNGAWHSGGNISDSTRALAADNGATQIGTPWTQSGGQFAPPFVGSYIVTAMFSFYEAGDNNDDNLEGSLQWYNGSDWVELFRMRCGHQYDGNYTRGAATASGLATITNASTQFLRVKTYPTHSNLDFAMEISMTYLGS